MVAISLIFFSWQELALAQMSDLVGTWRSADNQALALASDGKYEYRGSAGEEGYGEYRHNDILLIITDQATGKEFRWLYKIESKNLRRRLLLGSSEMLRNAAPPTLVMDEIADSQPGISPAESGRAGTPVGSWVVESGGIRMENVFASDGRYRSRFLGRETYGTYKLDGSNLIITTEDGKKELLEWRTDREYERRRLLTRDSMGDWRIMYEKMAP